MMSTENFDPFFPLEITVKDNPNSTNRYDFHGKLIDNPFENLLETFERAVGLVSGLNPLFATISSFRKYAYTEDTLNNAAIEIKEGKRRVRLFITQYQEGLISLSDTLDGEGILRQFSEDGFFKVFKGYWKTLQTQPILQSSSHWPEFQIPFTDDRLSPDCREVFMGECVYEGAIDKKNYNQLKRFLLRYPHEMKDHLALHHLTYE